MSHSTKDQQIQRLFKQIGLVAANKVTDTLQGSIWRASQVSSSSGKERKKRQTTVIKVTDELLHKHSMSIIDGHAYKVNENILLEQSILKYLTENEQCPKSIIKFQRFFKTNTDYYLQMEDGGSSLFDFIMNVHKLILTGNIQVNHWKKVLKIIFKQMVECIDYIHSKNVCHFDISLENFVINDVQVEIEKNGTNRTKYRLITDNIQIKLCDFGLAQLFTSTNCRSNKFCGKTNYKSPEVLDKKRFDGKKNDIWAVGVCLFMMTTGLTPWKKANKNDDAFVYMMNGKMMDVLNVWNVLHLMDYDLIALLKSIFQYESERISMKNIKQHSWIK